MSEMYEKCEENIYNCHYYSTHSAKFALSSETAKISAINNNYTEYND
jgi:hypothetical protein